MYVPTSFRLDDPAKLRQTIAQSPFALLITQGEAGLFATHLPFLYDPDREAPDHEAPDHEALGILRGHVARANPHWKYIADNQEALVIFSGPHTYISPRWYTEPDGMVPTWNYMAVHVYGHARTIADPAWLRTMLDDLSAPYETAADGTILWQPNWQDDSSHERLLRGIVGIEITISKMEGKAKLSQNRSLNDQQALIGHLEAQDEDMSRAVAMAMRQNLKS
ncbi:MAG: FMN-binding negative transcriptional regulator [Alphaproteobacteria bacterium]